MRTLMQTTLMGWSGPKVSFQMAEFPMAVFHIVVIQMNDSQMAENI